MPELKGVNETKEEEERKKEGEKNKCPRYKENEAQIFICV